VCLSFVVGLIVRCLQIEISPFLPCTGSACFSWARDRDVLEGRSPFEFRLVKKQKYGGRDDGKQRQHRSLLAQIVEANWERRWRPSSSGDHAVTHTDTICYKEVWSDLGLYRGAGKGENPTTKLSDVGRGVALSCGLGLAAFVAFKTPSPFTSSSFSTLVGSRGRLLAATTITAMSLLFSIKWSEDSCGAPVSSSSSNRRGARRMSEGEEIEEPAARRGISLFVYGTLKRGFHWHQKFLQRTADYRGKRANTSLTSSSTTSQ